MLVNKNLEKPATILNIPVRDMLLIGILFAFCIIIGYILMAIGLVSVLMVWGLAIGVAWCAFILLSWASRQNYPGFLLSYISYRFLQPKKIDVKGYYVSLKKDKEK